jgi:hypothetical protein
MKVQTKKIFSVALGFGLFLVGVGIAVLWSPDYSDPPQSFPTSALSQPVNSVNRATPAGLDAFKAEMKRELAALRSRLSQVDQDQASIDRELDQIAEARREQTVSKDTDAPPLTPEEEDRRAQAQIQAQIELIENARRAEPPDPQWASTAQVALHEAFQSKAVTGMQVGETDCRTTLCRAELLLDSSTSPQVISRELVHLAPWSGQSFIHLNIETGEGVIYLAREGHSLP